MRRGKGLKNGVGIRGEVRKDKNRDWSEFAS